MPSHRAKLRPSTPTVERILDKYLQAIGGETAHRKLTSRVMKGKFEIPEEKITGIIELETMPPNKMKMFLRGQTNNGARFDLSKVFDGEVCWEINPANGGQCELSGPELAEIRRDAEFLREIRLRELYPKTTLIEKKGTGKRAVHVIEATPREGNPEEWRFNAQTGLLVHLGNGGGSQSAIS
jgi:hypothetical protein